MFDGTGKPRKPAARTKARELRREGWSYKRIAAELDVSPSSALNWTRDIELTTDQIQANLMNGILTPEGARRRAKRKSEICRQRRREFQEAGRERARELDEIHRAGCMLYWAEGSKDRNQLGFANSDVHMIKVFAAFLRTSFEIPDADFTVRLNVYLGNGMKLDEIEDYWLGALALPRSCLRGHQINHFPTSSSGKKRSLPYGVCTLRVAKSTWIVQHIYGAIQEYGGFEEPRWLG
jgi:hypothetical protein